MSKTIHPQVIAEMEALRAREELELERLVSALASIDVTGGAYISDRTASLTGRIAEKRRVVTGWRQAVAVVATQNYEGEPVRCGIVRDGAQCLWSAGHTEACEFPLLRGMVAAQYLSTDLSVLICKACYRKGVESKGSVVFLTSDDLDGGGFCDQCYADVLA